MLTRNEEVDTAIQAARDSPEDRAALEAFAEQWGMTFEAAWAYAELNARMQAAALHISDLETVLARYQDAMRNAA